MLSDWGGKKKKEKKRPACRRSLYLSLEFQRKKKGEKGKRGGEILGKNLWMGTSILLLSGFSGCNEKGKKENHKRKKKEGIVSCTRPIYFTPAYEGGEGREKREGGILERRSKRHGPNSYYAAPCLQNEGKNLKGKKREPDGARR